MITPADPSGNSACRLAVQWYEEGLPQPSAVQPPWPLLLATKAGFNEEGLLRAYVKQRGSIKDVVMWSRVKQQCREEAVVWASVRQCHPAEGKASRGITKTLPSVFAAFT